MKLGEVVRDEAGNITLLTALRLLRSFVVGGQEPGRWAETRGGSGCVSSHLRACREIARDRVYSGVVGVEGAIVQGGACRCRRAGGPLGDRRAEV